jgi:hypothetical protein
MTDIRPLLHDHRLTPKHTYPLQRWATGRTSAASALPGSPLSGCFDNDWSLYCETEHVADRLVSTLSPEMTKDFPILRLLTYELDGLRNLMRLLCFIGLA